HGFGRSSNSLLAFVRPGESSQECNAANKLRRWETWQSACKIFAVARSNQEEDLLRDNSFLSVCTSCSINCSHPGRYESAFLKIPRLVPRSPRRPEQSNTIEEGSG